MLRQNIILFKLGLGFGAAAYEGLHAFSHSGLDIGTFVIYIVLVTCSQYIHFFLIMVTQGSVFISLTTKSQRWFSCLGELKILNHAQHKNK